ncbi:MAG: hypothetical protein H6739_08940 [Alphaproteobacteria bacterium]|nr:hypothetical protein [Alphaproteobacteria bacterium]
MDAREYLLGRGDVHQDEVEDIIRVAQRLQGDEGLSHYGGLGRIPGLSLDMDVRYLERAVRIYRRQKAEAAKVAEDAARRKRWKLGRARSMLGAALAVTMALGLTLYILGLWGSGNIVHERQGVRLAEQHLAEAIDGFASIAPPAAALARMPEAELDPLLRSVARGDEILKRVEAADQLDIALDSYFAQQPEPRSGRAAETWRATRAAQETAHHKVTVEAERYEKAVDDWRTEVESPYGSVAVWLGLSSDTL